MATLASAWEALTGPRVEDFWVEVLDVTQGTGPRVDLIPAAASFEDGSVGGWGYDWFGSPGAVTRDNSTTRAYDGTRSLRITYPNNAAGSGPQYFVATTIGVTYTARIPVWVPAASPAVRFGDPFGNTHTTVSTVKDAWEILTITWTAPTTVAYLVVRSTSATTGTEQVWIDKLRLVTGRADASETTEESAGGRLDGVTSCRVEHNVNATIRGGCRVTLRDVGDDLDWASVRFRPWVRVNDKTWPLGVYLPASPSLSRDEHGSAWDVPCLDQTSILDQDVVTATYSVAAGAVVTDEVTSLIESTGEASSVTPSTLTTRSPMTWEAGTPKLRIINDLLDSINYFAVWADRRGQLRAEPYRRPQDRTLAATFAAGETSILSPRWSREQDIAGVPNQTVLIVEGDEDEPGLISVATNTDPESPYSTVSRGRVVSRVYDNVEAADQATLDDLAARYLADASTPSASLSVAHASVPLDGNAVVRFADGDVDTLAVVEGWQVDLAPGALMSGTWREVLS